MIPELALRDGVMELLRASPEVAALVQDKVFDGVPSDNDAAELPWIAMGPISSRPVDAGEAYGWIVTLKVFAESADFDRTPAWTIARAAIAAVAKVQLPDGDVFLDELKINGAGDVIDPGAIKTVWFDVACLMAAG
ncbi:hypothetical protein ASF53_02040 [Methylobacterium sp. Leaf123]|uniref:tail completion protein gp17 n=1 Tax=Methylobacterium sp. Leaf123 TaxID=1736264 RepID=UPI0007010438|nr:DUF3168 domain-containing protein [Methylobacterium sp. Leaf123]KQQ31502.1 hypothetical protein ASF53_02040 [Methylobacterium sp. Leaf123]